MSYQPIYGDYGVVHTSGAFGKLIRLGTFSHWNHAVVYIGGGLLIEANPKGVQIKPVSEYKDGDIAWNQHEGLTSAQRTAIVAHAHSLVGSVYNFATIAVLTLRILGLRVLSNMSILKHLAEKDGYICSELVVACYNFANVVISDKPDYLTTPANLAFRLMYQ